MKGIITEKDMNKTMSTNLQTKDYEFIEIADGKAVFQNRKDQSLKSISLWAKEGERLFVKEKFRLEKALDKRTVLQAWNINKSIAFEDTFPKFIVGKWRQAGTLLSVMARKYARIKTVEILPANDELDRPLNFYRIIYSYQLEV